jgi:hypothetical protein
MSGFGLSSSTKTPAHSDRTPLADYVKLILNSGGVKTIGFVTFTYSDFTIE